MEDREYWCKDCLAMRPGTEFYWTNTTRDGLRRSTYCKTHTVKRQVASDRRNYERKLETNRRYASNHPEVGRRNVQAFRKRHKVHEQDGEA